jgi:hypothetical protein
MRRRTLPAILAVAFTLLGALNVSAHHVDVVPADGDRAAMESYVAEFEAQSAILGDVVELYMAAVSGTEKADAMLAVETALAVTVAHMESLPVPACATYLDELVRSFLEGIAIDFGAHKASGDPLTWPYANERWAALLGYYGPVATTLCMDEVAP